MSQLLNTFKVTTLCANIADPTEASEAFLMENHSRMVAVEQGLMMDMCDVQEALQRSWEKASRPDFKGGYRAFNSKFFKSLEEDYGFKCGGGFIRYTGKGRYCPKP